MKNKRKLPLLSVIMLAISASTIILSSFTDYNSDGMVRIMSLVLSICFWMGILIGYIYMFIFYRKKDKKNLKGRIGIISFFTNRYAVVLDVIMILDILLIVVLSLINFKMALVYSLLLGILFLTINLHCIFNGRVFNNSLRGREIKNDD